MGLTIIEYMFLWGVPISICSALAGAVLTGLIHHKIDQRPIRIAERSAWLVFMFAFPTSMVGTLVVLIMLYWGII